MMMNTRNKGDITAASNQDFFPLNLDIRKLSRKQLTCTKLNDKKNCRNPTAGTKDD